MKRPKDDWLNTPQIEEARRILADAIADPDAPPSDRIAASAAVVIAGYLEHDMIPELEHVANYANKECE